MRILFSISFIILCCIAVGAKDGYTRNPSIDIIHYNFSISVNDTNNVIYGHSEITVSFIKTVKTIGFDLKNMDVNGKGMSVKNVTFNKGSVKWEHSGDRILITMDDSVKAGSRGLFSIDYSGIPADGLIISDNKYGHRTFFADNWPDRHTTGFPVLIILMIKQRLISLLQLPITMRL